MPKPAIIIFLILTIILFCGVSFIFGLYVGKIKLSEKQIMAEKQNLVDEISGKIKKLPGMEVFKALPMDIIHGAIKSINGQKITLIAAPASVADLFAKEKEYQIGVAPETKIFYLELNAKTALFEEHPLALADLKPNETISITIDPQEKLSSEIKALKIKANR
ncbi:hypothetical protein HZB94_04360 [Candidatus Falkowbacteria bacterium]|nr:hypothetical protein [Candidatus Falkowbacteria bacterium]